MNRLLPLLMLLLPGLAAADGACFDAVQGKVAWNDKGAKRWNPGNVERLCKGAEGTAEPARCFDEVMHGDVRRGGGRWGWSRVIDLCQGTHDADARIACLEDRVAGGAPANKAVKACRGAGGKPRQRQVQLSPQVARQVLTAGQERESSGQEQAVRPEIATDAVRKAVREQMVQQGRRDHPSCEQVSLTRDSLRLEGAVAGGEYLKLEGCFGHPERDSVMVQVQSGERIERVRGRFSGSTARLRAPRIAFEDGAVASVLRTMEPGETYQLTSEVGIGRAETDADGDAHMAREWGGDDCDDGNASRFPGNAEIPDDDHVDEDCDPSTFGKVDEDRDRFFSDRYCNRQPDGTLLCGTDCDDRYQNVNPAHHETPGDGIDNDCDGEIDSD